MKTESIQTFSITVLSANNGTWQGMIEYNGSTHPFESEMQMLLKMMELAPELKPDLAW